MSLPQPINLSTYQLINFVLSQADNALLTGHRNSEWCGHGPVLEQDIAITNISLDLIGQARNFYQYAAALRDDGSTEDSFAYLRDVREFRNCLLTEQPNGDWAHTILRQFLFSNYQHLLYTDLQAGNDQQLAAIAEKALKEVAYHLRWSSEWVIRLGDGTAESHNRMERALADLWSYTGELFMAAPFEEHAAATGILVESFSSLKEKWEEKVKQVFTEATLSFPGNTFMHKGGKEGNHSEHLGFILAELQFMQRAYPNAQW